MIEIKIKDNDSFFHAMGSIKDIKTELSIAVHGVIDRIAAVAGQEFDKCFSDWFLLMLVTNAAYAEEKEKENAAGGGEGTT